MHFNIIGNKGPISKKLQKQIATMKNIIALDGAANRLIHVNIKPNIVIGDFDSITDKTIRILKTSKTEFNYIQDQNTTDLDKAISYCIEHNASSINIYNAIGGKRLDHTLMNLRLLKYYFSPYRKIIIYDDDSIIKYLENQEITIQGKAGDKLALMSFTTGIINSKGLKYEMNNYQLDFAYRVSVSNSLALDTATIKVLGNALVILFTEFF